MLTLQRRRAYQSPRGGSASGGAGLETVLISDAATRVLALLHRATDTVTLSDMAEKHPIARSTSDTVSISDAATRLVSLVRKPTAETVPLSDFADTALARTSSDSVSVTTATPRIGVNPHDAATITDAATRLLGLHVTASDAPAVSDAAHRTFFGNASDAVAISEGSHHAALNPLDSVSPSDSASRLLPGQRAATDSVGISDTATSSAVIRQPKPVYNSIAARRQRGGVGMRR